MRRLLDGARRYYHSSVTTLVRSGESNDDSMESLSARAAQLEALLRERVADVDQVKSELVAFKIKYRTEVGGLHEQLEELEDAIIEALAGERAARGKGDASGPSEPGGTQTGPAPRYTSDAVRRLFRDVAKAIHPDLSSDELTRDRRHLLMIEANRAYALGDEERLRWILQAWENSPEAVQGHDPESMRVRLARRIAQMQEQLDAFASNLAELQESPLWKMKVMVDEAAAKGKDLMRDMVGRLKRDIMVARNRLDALQSRP
jgi:hypothetical protein